MGKELNFREVIKNIKKGMKLGRKISLKFHAIKRYSMIKLKCPECDSDKVIFVSSELNEEDCFECEECNIVYPFSEMGWESE